MRRSQVQVLSWAPRNPGENRGFPFSGGGLDGTDPTRALVHAPLAARARKVAAALGVLSATAAGETAEACAHRLGYDPVATARLCTALESASHLAGGDRADLLPPPAAVAPILAEAWYVAAWDRLPEAVRSGRCAFVLAHGCDLFTWLDAHPAEAARFHRGMAYLHRPVAERLAATLDLAAVHDVVDVGGGGGQVLAALLLRWSHLRGIVLDRPAAGPGCRELMRHRVADRGRFVAGDFFAAIPPADALVLAHVLHDWDDDQALILLRRCREALPVGGLIAVAEPVLGEPAPGHGPLLDLELLVLTGSGRQRRRSAIASLLERSGFQPHPPQSAGILTASAIAVSDP